MLDPELGQKQLSGLTVYDAFVIVQVIDRLLKVGGVTGREVGHIASLRGKTTAAAKYACGVEIDNYKPEQKNENREV